MKINLLAPVLVGILSSQLCYAGAMGPISSSPLRPFVSLEGGYTWNKINGFNFVALNVGEVVGQESNKGFTGRVAAGMLYSLNSNFAVSSELGWGYYGRTNVTPVFTDSFANFPLNIHVKNTISGMDLLAGLVYMQSQYQLSLKAGGVIQNHLTDFSASSTDQTLSFSYKNNLTEVLPAIKLGAGYNLTNNWSLIGSYMHAFGSTMYINALFNANSLAASLSINRQNPTTDTVLAGIQYTA